MLLVELEITLFSRLYHFKCIPNIKRFYFKLKEKTFVFLPVLIGFVFFVFLMDYQPSWVI